MVVFPEIIETVGRNKKTFSVPTMLYKEGIITLFGGIDEDMSYSIITQLLFADMEETSEPVRLYVNSGGGIVTAGLAIIDTMNLMRRKVDITAMGSCASMAAAILVCGTGERKALKNTRIMLHSISSGSEGTVHDQIVSLEETKFLQENMMQMIADNTKGKMSLEEVKNATLRDFYFSAKEAIDLGIIDRVAE